MDIRLARKQLNTLFADLSDTDWRKVSLNINDFLNFLNQEPLITIFLQELPQNTVDTEEWVQKLRTQGLLEMPNDKKERLALCLAILDRYKDNVEEIAYRLPLVSGSSDRTDHIRDYVEWMAKPIYQYLDYELHKKEIESTPISQTFITAGNVIQVNGNNYGSISQSHNEVVRLLGELATEVEQSPLELDKKLEVHANIDTIKSQIYLSNPNWQIVKLAWGVVNAAATTSGAISLVQQILPLIQAHIK